jgi:cytoskeleton protein RodZ
LQLVADDRDDASDVAQLSIEHGADIGEALQAAREFRGMTLQDVADATRIRLSYVEALEALRLDDLPSRPFTIGYVKSYARLLGLDGEAAVARFKMDAPDDNEPLRAPVGVRRESDPRLGLLLGGGLLVVAAIVLWNVAQRAIATDAPPPLAAAVAPRAPTIASSGAVSLGAPVPAPAESTVPEPYKTPGLDDAAANGGSADAVTAASKARAVEAAANGPVIDAAETAALGSPFKTKAAVLGAGPADGSGVILQARKGASLVVRGADGSVFFARQLAPGEAYRVPRTGGLTADVSDPSAFNVYVGGVLTGRLQSPQTALGKLGG